MSTHSRAIVRKFGEKSPELRLTLASYKQKPEVWKEAVREMLREAGVDQDQEVLDLATSLATVGARELTMAHVGETRPEAADARYSPNLH